MAGDKSGFLRVWLVELFFKSKESDCNVIKDSLNYLKLFTQSKTLVSLLAPQVCVHFIILLHMYIICMSVCKASWFWQNLVYVSNYVDIEPPFL